MSRYFREDEVWCGFQERWDQHTALRPSHEFSISSGQNAQSSYMKTLESKWSQVS